MKSRVIKSKGNYKKVEFDAKKVKASQGKIRRKMSTSIKRIAKEKGIPYQVLMRSFIFEGLANLKKAS